MQHPRHYFLLMLVCIYQFIPNQITAQKNADTAVNGEIRAALQTWNQMAIGRNTESFMALYDQSADMLMVGSDSGEIFRGKAQIGKWLGMLFKHNSFSWEMNILDIDHYGKTAWVFMDGFMVVKNEAGRTRRTPYRFTGVLVRKKKVWKWRLFHGSVPAGH